MRRLILALPILATFLSGYAGSATQSNCDDDRAIRAVLQHYINGARRGDPVEMRRAFYEDATIFGWFYPNPDDINEVRQVSGSIQALYELTESLEPAPTVQAEVARVGLPTCRCHPY